MKPSIAKILLLLFAKQSVISALQVFKDLSLSLTTKKDVLMTTDKRPPESDMTSFISLNYFQK